MTQGKEWKVEIDRIKCDAHGLCAELLPERIRLDDWGYPIIADGLDERLLAHARKAVEHCPVRALKLVKVATAKS